MSHTVTHIRGVLYHAKLSVLATQKRDELDVKSKIQLHLHRAFLAILAVNVDKLLRRLVLGDTDISICRDSKYQKILVSPR